MVGTAVPRYVSPWPSELATHWRRAGAARASASKTRDSANSASAKKEYLRICMATRTT